MDALLCYWANHDGDSDALLALLTVSGCVLALSDAADHEQLRRLFVESCTNIALKLEQQCSGIWAKLPGAGNALLDKVRQAASVQYVKRRAEVVYGGLPKDVVMSWMQKAARRQQPEQCIRAGLLLLFQQHAPAQHNGSRLKFTLTNLYKRMLKMAMEDVGLADVALIRYAAQTFVPAWKRTRKVLDSQARGSAKWCQSLNTLSELTSQLLWKQASAGGSREPSHWRTAVCCRSTIPAELLALMPSLPEMSNMPQYSPDHHIVQTLRKFNGVTSEAAMNAAHAMYHHFMAGLPTALHYAGQFVQLLRGSPDKKKFRNRFQGNRCHDAEFVLFDLLEHRCIGADDQALRNFCRDCRTIYGELRVTGPKQCREAELCWIMPFIARCNMAQLKRDPMSMDGMPDHGDVVASLLLDPPTALGQVPDYVKDKHCGIGRAAGKTTADFALEGAKVCAEWLPHWSQRYFKALYQAVRVHGAGQVDKAQECAIGGAIAHMEGFATALDDAMHPVQQCDIDWLAQLLNTLQQKGMRKSAAQQQALERLFRLATELTSTQRVHLEHLVLPEPLALLLGLRQSDDATLARLWHDQEDFNESHVLPGSHWAMAQLITRSTGQLVYALKGFGPPQERLFVKADYPSKRAAERPLRIQKAKAFFSGVYALPQARVVEIEPDTRRFATPFGVRATLPPGQHVWCFVTRDVHHLANPDMPWYVTKHKGSKRWPADTQVIDWEASGIRPFRLLDMFDKQGRCTDDDTTKQWLMAVLFRWLIGGGDFADRNFGRAGDLFYSFDDDQLGDYVCDTRGNAKPLGHYIKSTTCLPHVQAWIKANFDATVLQSWLTTWKVCGDLLEQLLGEDVCKVGQQRLVACQSAANLADLFEPKPRQGRTKRAKKEKA